MLPKLGEMPFVLEPCPVVTQRSLSVFSGAFPPAPATRYTIKPPDCLIKGSGYTINFNFRPNPPSLSKRIAHPIPIYTLKQYEIFQRVLKPLK